MLGPDPLNTWKTLSDLRQQSPVIHNITNFVVMNNTANALLALGASPVMAHAEEEAAEMTGIASCLVLNIGTLSRDWVKAMYRAGEQALSRGIPIILDPVGAGATNYRTATARSLMSSFRPTIIRGNASEILALWDDQTRTKGVDSLDASGDAVAVARSLAETWGSVVCVSGAMDHIVSRAREIRVRNGHPMMTRVTGLGCTATALCGAFAAVNPDPVQAAAQAMLVMGVAGEMAVAGSAGPGTLQVRFLDALYGLTQEDLQRHAQLEC